MTKLSDIKRAQKASLLLRSISTLFLEAARDNKKLSELFINRVELSPDKGTVYIFFYTDKGQEGFNLLLKELTLYKPSLRAALAKTIAGRYTPELIFKFDTSFAKTQRIESLLDQIKKEETSETDSWDDDIDPADEI